MNFLKNSFFLLCLSILHIWLVYLFSMSYYILYFLNLIIILYILGKMFNYLESKIIYIFLLIVFLLTNLEIYDEIIFELSLWFNMIDKISYIDDKVIYFLVIIHIVLFINLKFFESFWAIIDKKLFRK